MKRVVKFLPVAALVLGSGLAIAGNAIFAEPNVKNVTPGAGAPNWQPISPGESVNCDNNTYRQCKAHMDEFGNISDVVYGDRVF